MKGIKETIRHIGENLRGLILDRFYIPGLIIYLNLRVERINYFISNLINQSV